MSRDTNAHDRWRNTLERRCLHGQADSSTFFELARAYTRTRGTRQPTYICGFVGVTGFVYEDALVEVSAAAESPALEIRFKYPDGTCTNPVVMVTDKGKVIRVHGEHCYVVPHIERLAAEGNRADARELEAG